MDNKNLVAGFLWLWVVAGMAAYLYQFQGFVRPILQYLGIS
jgi:hypothetical protein